MNLNFWSSSITILTLVFKSFTKRTPQNLVEISLYYPQPPKTTQNHPQPPATTQYHQNLSTITPKQPKPLATTQNLAQKFNTVKESCKSSTVNLLSSAEKLIQNLSFLVWCLSWNSAYRGWWLQENIKLNFTMIYYISRPEY